MLYEVITPGVVDDQYVAMLKIIDNLWKRLIGQRCIRAIEHQQSGTVTLGSRLLGDQVGRKIVIKIIQLHGFWAQHDGA